MILRIAQGDYLDIRIDIVDENGDPLYLEPGEKVIMHMNVRTAKAESKSKSRVHMTPTMSWTFFRSCLTYTPEYTALVWILSRQRGANGAFAAAETAA